MSNIRKVLKQNEDIFKYLETSKLLDLDSNLLDSDYLNAYLNSTCRYHGFVTNTNSFTITTPMIKHLASDNQIKHWIEIWFDSKLNDSESLDIGQDVLWDKEYIDSEDLDDIDSESYLGDTGFNCRIDFVPDYTGIDTSHFENTFLSLINPAEFDYGDTCEAEQFLATKLSENKIKVLSTLNALYLANYHNDWVTLGIMQILAHLDWDLVAPMGQTMALAALSNANVSIKESGIRAFEMWNRKECIPILEKSYLHINWLERYKKAVISDIRNYGQ